jgi:hypothetical protein
VGVKDVLGPILAGIAVGTAIPLTAPAVVPVVPTAGQVWAAKVRRLQVLSGIGTITGAMNTAITALRADVISTYAAGFESNL